MILVQVVIAAVTTIIGIALGGDAAPVAVGAAFFGGCAFQMAGAMRHIDRRPPR